MPRLARRPTVAFLVFVAVALFVAGSCRTAVVSGDSMQPTYHSGQVVFVNRWYRLTGPLHRGDVVLLRKSHEILIKRIAYLPGETIAPSESYRFWQVSQYFDLVPPGAGSPWPRLRVPPGYVVVLGDNPAVSDDSRAFGPVPVRDILGRVVNAPAKPAVL